MKIAIISDAHGNLLFFKSCIEAIQKEKVDRIVALGDYFGYMLDGKKVFDTLRDNNAILLKGNHEAMLLGELPLDKKKDELYNLSVIRKRLPKDFLKILRDIPVKYELSIDGLKILFVHGSPHDCLSGYIYEDNINDSLAKCTKEYDYIFMGHTHRPFQKKKGSTAFVNVGSCGLPRDCGLMPSFCLFDTKIRTCTIVRVNIDSSVLKRKEYTQLNSIVFEVFLRGEI